MNIITFNDFLFEKRSHAETNIDDSFQEFLHKINDIDTGFNNTFISFRDNMYVTDINKNNHFNTPTGFYCYPLSKYTDNCNIEEHKFRKLFPFATNRQYIVFFILNNKKGILDNKTSFEYIIPYIKKIKELYKDKISEMAKSIFDEYIKTSKSPIYSNIRIRNNAHQFWVFLYSFAELLNVSNKETFITNLCVKIGINGFIDDEGHGYIHQNEPVQAVFFKVKNLGKTYVYHMNEITDKTKEKLSILDLHNKKLLNKLKSFRSFTYFNSGVIINNKTCDDDIIYELKDVLNWNYVAMYYDLSDDFIEKYKDKLSIQNICTYKKDISDEFIHKNESLIDWTALSNNEYFISIENIDKYKDKLDLYDVKLCASESNNIEVLKYLK